MLCSYIHMAATTVESKSEITKELIVELRDKALSGIQHDTRVFESESGRVIVEVRIREARYDSETDDVPLHPREDEV